VGQDHQPALVGRGGTHAHLLDLRQGGDHPIDVQLAQDAVACVVISH
jgi:hypothetical protein